VRTLLPGCSLVLTVLDEGTLDSGIATQHIMLSSLLQQPSPAAAAAAADAADSSCSSSNSSSTDDEFEPLQGFLPPLQLPLDAFPSVQAVCRGRRLLFTSSFSRQTSSSSSSSSSSNAPFSDWQQLADSYGAECFLAVPLCFAQQDLGCVLLVAEQPAAIDKYVRKLVIELGLVVAQTLYTLLCMQQMRAGDQIINDMMPQQVRVQDTAFCACMLAEQPLRALHRHQSCHHFASHIASDTEPYCSPHQYRDSSRQCTLC
jgi:hypothetical protein